MNYSCLFTKKLWYLKFTPTDLTSISIKIKVIFNTLKGLKRGPQKDSESKNLRKMYKYSITRKIIRMCLDVKLEPYDIAKTSESSRILMNPSVTDQVHLKTIMPNPTVHDRIRSWMTGSDHTRPDFFLGGKVWTLLTNLSKNTNINQINDDIVSLWRMITVPLAWKNWQLIFFQSLWHHR